VTNLLETLISPHPTDWVTPPASAFSFIIQEANQLAQLAPQILQMIEADLNIDALNKKAVRIQDRQARHQQQGFLPGTEGVGAVSVSNMEPLSDGRPRMDARTCFLFLVIRGYLGGIKSHRAKEFITESMSLHLYLAKQGISMPSLSTINENVNKVSQKTRDAILDVQVQLIMRLGLDDVKNVTIDSTVTEANSCWPTDSKFIWMLTERLCRGLQLLAKFDLPKLVEEQIPDILIDLHRLDFEIACAAGKKDAELIREAKYTELFDLAEGASQSFAEAMPLLKSMADQKEYLPSQRKKLIGRLDALQHDLDTLDHLISISARRVLEKGKISTEERVPSISDPDAAFISKGQRETKLGYRPQVSKSANGFVLAVTVPQGNAADSDQLTAIVDATFKRTGVVSHTLSIDDGYSSQANWDWLKEDKGVTVPSFSGSKGRKITPEQDWEAEAFRETRRMRSAVESVIFQLRRIVHFGNAVRRGIENVREELTEKVVAFNFYRMQYLIRQ
jgi:hypothetical protein